MQLTHNINLPPTYGKIVETYIQTLERDVSHPAFTVSDNLQIVGINGRIENNQRLHYNHNSDNSEDELFIIYVGSGKKEKRWWTTDFAEAQAVRARNIKEWENILKTEIKKYA